MNGFHKKLVYIDCMLTFCQTDYPFLLLGDEDGGRTSKIQNVSLLF